MELIVVGVNHRKAPVELREKLAFDPHALEPALAALRAATGAAEAVILSTCNRVELYLVREGGDDALAQAARFLSAQRGEPERAVTDALCRHDGAEAVRHLFEVASSIDSMVVGETQIIAQVKHAYLAAMQGGHTGRVLNPLFQRALAVAKQVHATTGLARRSLSVPSVAAQLAEKIFQDLAGKRVLVLGAGETASLTLQAFLEREARDVIVVNRTAETARALAQQAGGTGHGLDELASTLPRADVVIACLTTEHPVVGPDDVRAALRERRQEPMFFIDIAVPRAVDPAVNRIDNVYLFNIDDLQGIVDQHLLERQADVARCAPLLERETDAAMRELAALDVRDVLKQLRDRFESVGEEELKRALGRLPGLTEEEREEIGALVRRVVGKLLHAPLTTLKEEAINGHTQRLIDLATRLFNLK